MLTVYYAATFILGVVFSLGVSVLMLQHEVGFRGGALMTLCWNVLFVLILPLVLDWGEHKHCNARFVQLEEVAASNPELAAILSEQCKKLSMEKLRLAVVESPSEDVFGYGLWGSNPRLVVSGSFLNSREKALILPSVEAELARVKSQDHAMLFFIFTIVQVLLQHLLLVLLRM